MKEYIIQNITKETRCEYEKLCAVSFHWKLDGISDEDAFTQKLLEQEKNATSRRTQLYGNRLVRTGLFSNGKLQAAMSIYPYVVRFDGKACEMGGIGGVVSNPEVRRSGFIRRLYQQVFEDMRNRGQILSQLYPFSASFYRKFGYEYCANRGDWLVPTEYLPNIEFSEMVRYENSDKQKEELKKVYNIFCKTRNLSVIRSEADWKIFQDEHMPFETDAFSYLHYCDGQADGFLSYTVLQYPAKAMNLQINNLYYTNGKALHEMLAFLRGNSAFTDQTKIPLPENTDISLILSEMCGQYGFRNTKRELVGNGMARVVDVQEILKLAAYKGEGCATIRIHDPICQWNDKCLQIDFNNALCRVVEGTTPDAEMSINAFSALILGRYSLDECEFIPDLQIYGNFENLSKIFYKKNIWIEEGF